MLLPGPSSRAGPTLSSVLARHGRLAEPQAAALMLQVVDALVQLHARGFAHRDVKPTNILLLLRQPRRGACCGGGVYAKLGDLGLSCPTSGAAARGLGASAGAITDEPVSAPAALRPGSGRRRSVCGSIKFMAPEVLQQAQGRGREGPGPGSAHAAGGDWEDGYAPELADIWWVMVGGWWVNSWARPCRADNGGWGQGDRGGGRGGGGWGGGGVACADHPCPQLDCTRR